jgi:hypothetical protein
MPETDPTPVRVFISYSHDSTEHEERVFAFSKRLRDDGVDATIDQYESPSEGWPFWMERQIDESAFVLIVCTKGYLRRVEKKEDPTMGRVVVWEINSIYNRLYETKLISPKFIPVLMPGSTPEDIPFPIKGVDRFDVSSNEGYEELFQRLTNQARRKKPPLGKLRLLPEKERNGEALPGAFSLQQLSKTMSNPKYADDLYRLDRTYQRNAVINRETIIIVVGTTVIAELLDRAAAELLRDHIDQRGAPYPYRRGIIVTHDGWVTEAEHIGKNAVIAIGGPPINRVTNEFDKWVPGPGEAGRKYPIPGTGGGTGFFRKNSANRPQVALWGNYANDTRETVEHYIKDAAGVTAFLKMCWK